MARTRKPVVKGFLAATSVAFIVTIGSSPASAHAGNHTSGVSNKEKKQLEALRATHIALGYTCTNVGTTIVTGPTGLPTIIGYRFKCSSPGKARG